MALVLYGGGVSEFRGSIGGSTFSRNKAGAIVRNKTYPVKKKTQLKAGHQSSFSYLVGYYNNTLTYSQRQAWTSYASGTPFTNKLGQTYYMSGLQAFLRTNIHMLSGGFDIFDYGPTSTGIPTSIGISQAYITVDASAMTVSWANGSIPALQYLHYDTWIFFYQFAPKTYGSTWIFDRPKLIGSIFSDYPTPPSYPLVFDSLYPLTAGQICGVGYTYIDSLGRTSSRGVTGKLIQA